MNLNEAFKRAVKAYYEDDKLSEFESVLDKERKYTKAYFDSIENEFGLSVVESEDEKELEKKKSKKGKK